ncbi:MAG: T9SS type A sorting domain-containing protein [Candidatus Delongbacteria bacterium]|jgi:hypothetical protein|nr:T9SS type A sorting domain-containing protein [Candidatus Delongbacteria bacterium]
MKKVLILTLLCVIAQLLSVIVDGYAFLEGETDHSGVQVLFQRVAPDTLFNNSALSDSVGYYSCVVEEGWYDVEYHKSGFVSKDTLGVNLYSDQTLNEVFLIKEGMSGSISGILTAGEYFVTGTLTVDENDSLIIEPGVTLNFATDTDLIVNGYLKAEGTEEDSICFNALNDDGVRIYIKDTSIGSKISYSNLYCIGITVQNDCELEHLNMTDGSIGIGHPQMELIKVSVINCTINNFTSGITATDNSEVVVDNVAIKAFDGMRFFYCKSLSLNNVSIYAGNVGIQLAASDSAKINNCCIYVPDGYEGLAIWNMSSEGISINNTNALGWVNGFSDCGPYIGNIVTTNSNGDPCDAYGNISMDPMFVDVDNGDLRLQSSSPCIDTGTNTITDYEFPIGDLDGNYRIWDGDGNSSVIVDMGAFEYGSHSTSINDEQLTVDNYELHQNYPNPFNPVTSISYSLIENAQVNLRVFNIAGREVCDLVDSKQNKGSHEVKFDGSILTSGIYFYSLSIDGKAVENRKMMLLK